MEREPRTSGNTTFHNKQTEDPKVRPLLFCTCLTYNVNRSSGCSVAVREYTLSTRKTAEGRSSGRKTILWTYCYVIRLNYLIPNYFLCFFADFFFSSRTSFWTRFNIGCAHIVRSIMPFAGWATRFLTLDFLGAIFFWYFSLRKIFRRKQKFCWVQMCSICCSCSWRPWRLKRKIWRRSRGSLHPCFVLIVCMFVMLLKTLKTF